jgi:hypothetical protein
MTLTRRDARPHPGLSPHPPTPCYGAVQIYSRVEAKRRRKEKENYPPSRVMSCVGIGRVDFRNTGTVAGCSLSLGRGSGRGRIFVMH